MSELEGTLATTQCSPLFFRWENWGGIMGPRSYGWLGTKPGLDLIHPPALLPWKQSLHTKHVCVFTPAYALQSMVKSARIQHLLTWEPVVAPYCPPYRISHLTFKIQSLSTRSMPQLFLAPSDSMASLPFAHRLLHVFFTPLCLSLCLQWSNIHLLPVTFMTILHRYTLLCSLRINATLLCTKWPAPVDVCWVFHVGLTACLLTPTFRDWVFF